MKYDEYSQKSKTSIDVPAIIKVELPKQDDISKVRVVNPTNFDDSKIVEAIENNKTEIITEKFDDSQIVEAIKEVRDKKTEKIDFSAIENLLIEIKKIYQDNKIEIPTEYNITNLPTGDGNNPKKSNPSEYVNVRLTDGEKFYKAIDHAIASAGGSSGVSSSIGNNVQSGQKTITQTNVAVSVGSGKIMNGCIIQALSTNTGSIYVGNSGVTTSNGFELQPGQATSLAINDLSKLYINGTANDGCCFISTN